MSSYGAFIAACGFTYYGPKRKIGFAPKIRPDSFKSAFVTAQGWGSFTQQRVKSKQFNSVALRHGELKIKHIDVVSAEG